jgi:capsular exopolysaccharide synthesis family protein
MAKSGRRTLIVDTDLRRGTMRRVFGLPKGPGLSDLLSGQVTSPPYQALEEIPNLTLLAAGPAPPNPSDLLASRTMDDYIKRWREEFDFVVLDSAPILPVTDTMALNGEADVTVLIVRSKLTEKAQARRSFRLLTNKQKHYVGIVLNGLNTKDSSYYGYYGYGENAYPYGSDRDE